MFDTTRSAAALIRRKVTGARRRLRYLTSSKTVESIPGVVEDKFRVNGQTIRFSYRPRSTGDRGVVGQVFGDLDCNVERWHQGMALREFGRVASQNGLTPLVIDAGANIGASCRYFLASYPGIRVAAIEPEKVNCALLRMNCRGLAVDIIEGAIGGHAGELALMDPGLSDWGFRVAQHGAYSVSVQTPQQILARYPRSEFVPFVFKIDIEGGEINLFEQGDSWFDEFPCLMIELHDWMLPGKRSAQPFLRAAVARDFDFIHRGENLFCFNNRLLEQFY